MTLPPAPDRLFGLPRRMSVDTLRLTLDELRLRFDLQYGRPPGDLDDDLQAMRQLLFNPVAREERLRQALATLAEQDRSGPPPDHIPELLLLRAGEMLWLVTPEGRVSIPVLERSLSESTGDAVYVDDVDIHAAEHLLLDVSRNWLRYRLDGILKLQAGAGARMLPVAIAIPLILLVNGNVGETRAMRQPKSLADQQALDQALVAPVRGFAEALSGRSAEFSDRHLALYNGYALSEARRRLGASLRLDRLDSDLNQHHARKALYIQDGDADGVIDFLARELRERGHSTDVVAEAYRILTDAYAQARPTLAAFGIVHEDPARTRSIGDRLLKAMADS